MSKCTHVQNNAYAIKIRRTYVLDVHQFSNPAQCEIQGSPKITKISLRLQRIAHVTIATVSFFTI